MAGGGGGALFATRGGRKRRPRWVGRAAILDQWPEAPQWVRYVVLTSGMFGIQLVWSCEMAQASPYLLSLGLSKAMMSIVFLAGPLSGLIVQPVVGIMSDACQSRLGRRRPFIIGGCGATALAVLLLGWAPDVAAVVASRGSSAHRHFTIFLAILSVYVIDFSINVVQAMDRALLVDVVPSHLQPDANAWVSRTVGVGAVLAYWIGGLDLVWLTGGWLGATQLKVLTIFTSFWLCVCHLVVVVVVKERVLIEWENEGEEEKQGISAALVGIWDTLKTLPKPIQQVLNVQFASWIGWFPILFFSTTWVAETYVRSQTGSSDLSAADPQVVERGTRLGTRSMLYHSIVALLTSIFLPPLITSEIGGGKMSLGMAWTFSNGLFATLLFCTMFANSVVTSSIIVASAGFCWAVTNWAPFSLLGDLILRMSGNVSSSSAAPIALNTIEPWTPPSLSHHTVSQNPHSPNLQKGKDLSSQSSPSLSPNPGPLKSSTNTIFPGNNGGTGSNLSLAGGYDSDPYGPGPADYGSHTPMILQIRHSDDLDSVDGTSTQIRGELGFQKGVDDGSGDQVPSRRRTSGDGENGWGDESGFEGETDEEMMNGITASIDGENEGGDQAGVILGCHNMYVVLPQFVVTAISSIIFAIFAPGHSVIHANPPPPLNNTVVAPTTSSLVSAAEMLSNIVDRAEESIAETATEGWDALGLIFRIAGVSVAVSCYLCWKMARDRDRERVRRSRGF